MTITRGLTTVQEVREVEVNPGQIWAAAQVLPGVVPPPTLPRPPLRPNWAVIVDTPGVNSTRRPISL